MPNERRIRQNFIGGTLQAALLDEVGPSTMTSDALAALVAVGATQHLPIVLDPDGLFGAPEIAWITAHTATATTATIARGQEGSTRRAHGTNVPWVHGPLSMDFGSKTSYTPNWTSDGTAPAIGNGTIAGHYAQFNDLVMVRIQVEFGSTTTFGTGEWSFSLPTNLGITGAVRQACSWMAIDISAFARYGGAAELSGSQVYRLVYNNQRMTPTVPFTWASGDILFLTGTYFL